MLKKGKNFTAACEFTDATRRLSEKINQLVKVADPHLYTRLLALRKKVNEAHPAVRALAAVDSLVLDGREILFNKRSSEHADIQDPQLGWAILFAAGSFKGGHLVIKALGLRIRLEPGGLVKLRGRVLKHC